MADKKNILVINAGSSSDKISFFQLDENLGNIVPPQPALWQKEIDFPSLVSPSNCKYNQNITFHWAGIMQLNERYTTWLSHFLGDLYELRQSGKIRTPKIRIYIIRTKKSGWLKIQMRQYPDA